MCDEVGGPRGGARSVITAIAITAIAITAIAITAGPSGPDLTDSEIAYHSNARPMPRISGLCVRHINRHLRA